ncbi:MAG: pilus assembly protein N-terminal domain-containing protein [Caulobacteraceae bacterium]
MSSQRHIRRVRTRKAAGLAALVAALCAGSSALAVTVRLDETKVVRLRAAAGDVFLGNAAVADVTMLAPDRIAIIGRGYGATSLLITDHAGRSIYSDQINVSPTDADRVQLHRGGLESNFTCSPRCERTPLPGEDKASADAVSGVYKDYASGARGDAAASTPP